MLGVAGLDDLVATCLAVSMGMAKPIPIDPPFEPLERIWLVIPITWPWASSSGPPELPWLIAASVWIAP